MLLETSSSTLALGMVTKNDKLLILFTIIIYCRRLVFAKEVSGRFDVGGLQSYLECCERYKPSKS